MHRNDTTSTDSSIHNPRPRAALQPVAIFSLPLAGLTESLNSSTKIFLPCYLITCRSVEEDEHLPVEPGKGKHKGKSGNGRKGKKGSRKGAKIKAESTSVDPGVV